MSVYVMDEFARVRPRDAPGSKRVAVLSAARNEYAPFQIIGRAGTGGLKRVNAVAMSGFLISGSGLFPVQSGELEEGVRRPLPQQNAGRAFADRGPVLVAVTRASAQQ
jgi:hypothetical protein